MIEGEDIVLLVQCCHLSGKQIAAYLTLTQKMHLEFPNLQRKFGSPVYS